MSRERFEERRQQYLKAAGRLREALDQPETSFMRDAIIQRFEFTFELAWTALNDYLKELGVEVSFVKPTLAKAFEGQLISDERGWSDLLDLRNKTSHTYDEPKAIAAAAMIRQKGMGLFEELAETLKSL